MQQKPIILLNIDSLMPDLLETAVQTGRAKALEFLMENGSYFPNVVSSFPTMSVTIDSSILTGAYADKHKIPGLNWFDVTNKERINYGTGFFEVYRTGMRKTIYNMLYSLNNKHLSEEVTTIFEELANHGLPSASINSFVYRGNQPTTFRVPKLLKTFTYFKDGKITTNTPDIISLGAFSKINPRNFTLQIAAGNYKFTSRELKRLIQKNQLPVFTFCVFQDLDLRIHIKGMMDLKGISKIDREIQKIFNLFPSWEEAIKQCNWIVIGDNGHSPLRHKRKEAQIQLHDLLQNYKIAKINRPIRNKDQIVVSVNQRMAYIYVLDQTLSMSALAEELKKDNRIDIIAWKEDPWIRVESGAIPGALHFKKADEMKDEYDEKWKIRGNLEILDLKVKNGVITYHKFPDALARLYGALFSQKGRFFVVNAKPGYEFKAQLTPAHPSAAHGSLHRHETLVPLIISGTKETPNNLRLIDLKDFILRQIGL